MPLIMCLECGTLFRPVGQPGRKNSYCPAHAHLATGLFGAKGRNWNARSAALARDGWRCTRVLEDGRRCPERIGLEVHHLISRRAGGPEKIANLKTVCKKHHPRGDRMTTR